MQHLPPGTLLHQYRIVEVLGAGGFGVTYLAKDEKLNKLFAVKEYFPEGFSQRVGTSVKAKKTTRDDFDWGKERFMDEARRLARFSHPSIVAVTQIFETNRTAYMVLEYQGGRDFAKWLKEIGRPPTQAELDTMVEPILDALEVIHCNNLLHRDIAPDNIYIRDNGLPVLLDFGSARDAVAKKTKTMSAIVKSGYSPAEQYAARGSTQGPWSDIYSLAATLYRALTGDRPDDATDRMLSESYVPARQAAKGEFRNEFLDAIDWGLKLSPGDRPQSVADWRTALLAGKGQKASTAKRQSAEEPASDQGNRPQSQPKSIKGDAKPDRTANSASAVRLVYFAVAAVLIATGGIWLSVHLQNQDTKIVTKTVSVSTPVTQPSASASADSQETREAEAYRKAHGDLRLLNDYLATCKICAFRQRAKDEIESIQKDQREVMIRAKFFNLRVCNRTSYSAAVVVAGRKQLGPDWTIGGWRLVDANTCANLGRYAKGKIYTMAKVHNGSLGWFGSSTSQCVEFPGPFERVIAKDFVCPSSGKTYGFFEISVSDSDFTWEISGAPAVSELDYFQFEVCNRSKYDARVSVMGRKDLQSRDWIVEGWFRVPAHDCMIIGRYAKKEIYSVALVKGSSRLAVRGNAAKLCVQFPGPFARVNTAGYRCRSNERLESFRKIEVMSGVKKFTWNLDDEKTYE